MAGKLGYMRKSWIFPKHGTVKPASSASQDPLPPFRPHFVKVIQPSQAAPLAGDQQFKCLSFKPVKHTAMWTIYITNSNINAYK